MEKATNVWENPLKSLARSKAIVSRTNLVSLKQDHPLARWAKKKKKEEAQTQISQVSLTAGGELLKSEVCSPSLRPKWPCPGGRTWSGLSRPAGRLRWRRRRSLCGWRSHSVKAEEKKRKNADVLLYLYLNKNSLQIPTTFFFAHPDLHVSPLAEPLFSRFRGGEFRHFFSIELQNAWVFVPHDLPQEKRHNISRLPVWCVEQVR